jgi:hypothetical protein
VNLSLVILAVTSLAGMGAPSGPDPTLPDEGAAPAEVAALVEPARAGLGRLLAANPDSSTASPPSPECTLLVDRPTVDAAFATAGVDVSFGSWSQFIGTVPPERAVRAISCSGSYVGAEDDSSFPELTAILVAADFGDTASFARNVPEATGKPQPTPTLGGSTVGECEDVDLTHQCREWWESGGLAVGLWVVDRIFIDRPTMSAVLIELVPPVLAKLAGRATDIADPLAAVTTADVQAAAAGLAGAPTSGECPALGEAELAAALATAGSDLPTDGWAAGSFARPVEGAINGMQCTGGDADAMVTVTVLDFGDPAAADDFVASVGLPDGGSGADLEPGDRTVGTCIVAVGMEHCSEWWRQDGLAVGVALFAESSDIARHDASEVLVAVVPTVLTNLAP